MQHKNDRVESLVRNAFVCVSQNQQGATTMKKRGNSRCFHAGRPGNARLGDRVKTPYRDTSRSCVVK